MVVVRTGSELMISPLRLHVIDRGLSPLVTAHISCAESPWLTGCSPNENGMILGGSKNNTNVRNKKHLTQLTIKYSSASHSGYHWLSILQSVWICLQHFQLCMYRLHCVGNPQMIWPACWLGCPAWLWSGWGQMIQYLPSDSRLLSEVCHPWIPHRSTV